MPSCSLSPWWRAIAVLLPVAFLLSGCGQGEEPMELEEVTARYGGEPAEPGAPGGLEGIRLVRAPAVGPEYPNVRLGILEPEPGARLPQGAPVELRFALTGFELGVPTPGAKERGLSRTVGQYLQVVVNGNAHQVVRDLSQPVVLEGLSAGTHVVQAYPGREWHEAVKTPGALAQRVLVVGEGDPEIPPPEEWGPGLIYSRPEGTYRQAEADSVLVDFYLSGVRLAPDGYRVRLGLNGHREFLIHEWGPYVLLGLPSGEHTVRMELVDGDGARVRTRFTPAERTIRVLREGPRDE